MSLPDPQKDFRTKCKFVLEIRYDPLVQIFDRRGLILEKVFPAFQKKAEHWRTDNSQVVISDDFDSPMRIISIGHMASTIAYEDPNSIGEFLDDSKKFLKLLKGIFPEGINKINRMGFRSISIFRNPKHSDFVDYFNIAKSKFISPMFPSTLSFNDFHITLAHDSCRILVGPCKAGEGWVKSTFNDQDKNIPKAGFGIDVDSFAVEIPTPGETNIFSAYQNVQNLTFAAESEIIQSLLKV